MPLDDIKVGNIIGHQNSFGIHNHKIVDISETKTEGRLAYSLEDPSIPNSNLTAYAPDIRYIPIDEDVLKKLGFEKDANAEMFTFSDHTENRLRIGRFSYDDNVNNRRVYGEYRLMPYLFPMFNTYENLMNETVQINFVNSLQNFCKEQNINFLNFDSLISKADNV